MKKRLLSLVLCLVMVFSLFPAFAAPAHAEDIDDQYEEATPADGRSWTTNDTYTFEQDGEVGYFAYDETDHKYYRVQYQSGKDLYTATEERDWQPADARGYYYGENKTTFYPVTVSDGDVYVLYTNENGEGNRAWVDENIIIETRMGTDWDLGTTNYYVYYNGEMRHLLQNVRGWTHGSSGGWFTVYYYLKDESGESFDPGNIRDHDNTSLFVADEKWYTDQVDKNNVVWLANTDYDHDYEVQRKNYLSTTSPIVKSFVLAQEIYSKSTLPKTINYNNGQVLGSILLSTDVAYHGKLYFKSGITGTTKLWYTRDNGEVVTLGASAIDKDTLYDGTLYIQLPSDTKYVLNVPGPSETSVPEDYTITNPGTASDDTGKIKLNKTLEKKNGAYDLTLESYAVAGNTTVQKTVKTPTDFVVVVDQSGSMDEPDIPTGYGAVSTQKTLEQVAAGEYYVNVDGEYYRVFAKRGYLFEQFPSNSLWTEDIVKDSEQGLHWFQSNTAQTFTVKNQYYVKDGTAYRPVNVEIEGKIGTYYVQFYWYPGGTVSDANKTYFDRTSQPWYHSVTGGTIKPGNLTYGAVNGAVKTLYPRSTAYTYSTFAGIRTGMFINKEMYKRHVGYTGLYYRDVNGEEHPVMTTGANPIESTEYCNSSGNAVTTAGGTTRMNYMGLYTASGTTTRLDALKAALNQFASAVAGDKDDVGYVQNRVAIVGFASEPSDTDYWNTEMLTVDLDGTNGKQMRAAGAGDYSRALVSASAGDNGQVNSTVSNAINAITADGGTQPEYGFQMAKSILDSRSETEKKDRNSVVIFFTDGRPGDFGYVNQYVEANDVVEDAYKLKTASYEPTIYSIGVFGESDGNPLLEPQHVYDNDLRRPRAVPKDDDLEYEGGFMEKILKPYSINDYYYMRRQWRPDNTDYTATPNDTIYDYMSAVSSNYPNAHTFIEEAWLAGNSNRNYIQATEAADIRDIATAIKDPQGKLQNDYYRMASTQATLVAAFEDAITKTVETDVVDETTSALDANTAIRDKINLDLFNIENATYSVKIVPVRANVPENPVMDGETKVYNWTIEENIDADHPVTVVVPEGTQVPEDGVLTASGMDYATAYVNRRHDGYKLVLEVTGLQPKKFNTTLTSNDGNASVVPNGGEFPLVEEKSPTLNAYHPPVIITWVNYDDSELQSKPVPYGDMPVYEQDTPVKPRQGDTLFTFIGWDQPIVAATESKTYKAVFESKNMESKTVIADFNAGMVLATETSKDQVQPNGECTNGVFSVNEDDQALYQLNSSALNGENTSAATAVDLTPYSGGDSARIEGRHINLETGRPGDEIEWKNVTVYPASNVYFSDHTAKTTVVANDQIGFNKGILPDSITADDQQLIGGRFFKFQGTGIDIYCKTTPQSGTVSAVLYKFVGEELKSVKTKIVMNASIDGTQTRFNAPTVFFNADDGVDPTETYVVRLYAASQADYHLDGIRVYNASQSTEQNVVFVNLRSMLLSKASAAALTPSLADGAVFYTDSGSMGTAPDSGIPDDYGSTDASDEVKKYEPNDYQHKGPKNEVYLAHNQAIGFQVQSNQEVMVSMRVPEGGNAVVRFNKDPNQTYLLSSVVDMYYPVKADSTGIVFIENLTEPGEELVVNEEGQPIDKDGNVITIQEGTDPHNVDGVQFKETETFVSLVNVKFTPAVSGSRALRASAKLNTFAMSAPIADPEPEVEPTPAVTPDPEPSPSAEPSATPSPSAEPTPEPSESPIPSISSLISQIFSSFLNNLFGSISRLFGN